SPDGQRLASASSDQTVKLWETATGKELLTLKGHTSGVSSVAFSPDGQRLASTSWDQTVKLWETATLKALLPLKRHTSGVSRVAFSPDGQRLASASYDQTVKLWEMDRLPLEILRQREIFESASDLVNHLFSVRLLRADVVQALRSNKRLPEPLREAAL